MSHCLGYALRPFLPTGYEPRLPAQQESVPSSHSTAQTGASHTARTSGHQSSSSAQEPATRYNKSSSRSTSSQARQFDKYSTLSSRPQLHRPPTASSVGEIGDPHFPRNFAGGRLKLRIQPRSAKHRREQHRHVLQDVSHIPSATAQTPERTSSTRRIR